MQGLALVAELVSLQLLPHELPFALVLYMSFQVLAHEPLLFEQPNVPHPSVVQPPLSSAHLHERL